MIELDGSLMEGGGQLLRLATSYSAILNTPISVYNIRAKRSDPGLKPQHLATLQAATKITRGKLSGASLGSDEIVFEPTRIRGGEYSFDIGTAGSISLLLQCINPILFYGDKPSRVSVRGGTAVNWSPTAPFLEHVIYPALESMDAVSKITVERHGFYPKGGGSITQYTRPVTMIQPMKLDKPDIKKIHGLSLCGALPEHVATRQAESVKKKLNSLRIKADIKPVVAEPKPLSPGSLVCLWAEGTDVYMGADSLGARGKPSEVVGGEAATMMIEEIRSGANVDRHTADHLILPTSLADGVSMFRTSHLTLHTLTAIEIAKLFTDAEFIVRGREGEPGSITVHGVGLENRG